MALILTFAIGLVLAYANGANDNFKGVATLLGSRTASYRGALGWATVTTALGSIAAFLFATQLLSAFSGKGLVPAAVAATPSFALSVASAAGATVLLATRLGFPISTTHALIGALAGAGLLASPTGLDIAHLQKAFLLPLLVSPFLAISLSAVVYPALRRVRRKLGVRQETCVCVGNEIVGVVPGNPGRQQALQAISLPTVSVGTEASCEVRYQGAMAGVRAQALLDAAHYLSAGMVSFARGLNDTPKIAALLLVGSLFSPVHASVAVGVAIAVGGWLSARRVAETMSHRVTEMNAEQGFAGNLVTGLLVVGASHLGMPVSTTHVSCGSLFGIGASTGQAHWGTIVQILLAWVITLPLAATLGALTVVLLELAL